MSNTQEQIPSELNCLNSQNGEFIEDPNEEQIENETTSYNEKILKRQKCIKIWIVAFCALLFIFTILIVFLAIKPFLSDLYCPSDNVEFIKLKSHCSGISKTDLCTYRYHQLTNKCYKLGSFGVSSPCPENMLFYYQDPGSNSHLGECICDYNQSDRTLIKDPKGENCYYVFQQGYCDPGYWLDFDYENESNPIPVCAKSSCINLPGINLVPYLLKDENEDESIQCLSNKEKSTYCPDPKEDYIIDFTPSSLYPICVLDNSKNVKPNFRISGSPGIKALGAIRTVRSIPPRSRKARLPEWKTKTG